MKKCAFILLLGAMLAGSIDVYADGTGLIMNGQYVTSIDTGSKIGPSTNIASTGDVEIGAAPETANGTAASNNATSNEAASDTTGVSAAAASNPKLVTSVTGVQGANSGSAANSTVAGNNSTADTSGNAATVGTDTTAQTAAQSGSNTAAVTTVGTLELDKLKVPNNATVLVTLAGTASGDTGTLTLLKRDNKDSAWVKLNECTAKYGKAGLGKTKEGDNKTPIGVFKMNTPFGIQPPEAGFPSNYNRVDNANYWNGDSKSELYNKLVSTKTYTDFKLSESEHLIKYAPYYNYCIDTGYNAEGTPYKGSAIFLHCVVNNENTHGCIAIPEENMKEVLRTYAEGSTYIAIYDTANAAAVYK